MQRPYTVMELSTHAPSQFQQIYTIHARIDDQMYPILCTLLPGKIQAIYTQLLTKLKTSKADIQLQLAPTTIFMDLKSSCSTTRTDGFNRRRLVQCTKLLRRH